MKKYLTPLLFLIFVNITLNAQFVTIPDIYFKNFLQQKYPGCFNSSNQLDTTCTAILSETNMRISQYPNYSSIQNIDGVQYFKGLQTLDCSNIYFLQTIPRLPASLLWLNCSNTSINSLTGLPANLQYLNISTTRLTSLANLPNSISYLICSYSTINNITAFPQSLLHLDCSFTKLLTPPAFPAQLKYLNIGNITDSAVVANIPPLPAALDTFIFNNNSGISLPVLNNAMTYFDCSNSQIPSFSTLPSQLKYLNCFGNWVTSLPPLPTGLTDLNASSNRLTSLPALPGSLSQLNIDYNRLTSLPALPSGIKSISCVANQLTALPALPATLQLLNCSNNLLTIIPSLPAAIYLLNCNANQLTTLPALPDSLQYFGCSINLLTNLPALPAKLQQLNCSNNKLTSLPNLPANLSSLTCSHNKLVSLPALPSQLSLLGCDANELDCLPRLNERMTYLTIDSRINCIGFRPPSMYAVNVNTWESDSIVSQTQIPGNSFPLCNPVNNINNCQTFPVISGKVFIDANNNGIEDPGEVLVPAVKVQLSNGNYTFTNNNGYYEIATDNTGTYTATVTVPQYYSAAIASYNFTLNDYTSTATGDFALQLTTIIDKLSLNINDFYSAARPGFAYPYYVRFQNTGSTTLSPVITIDYDETRLQFDSCPNPNAIDNNGMLSLQFNNLAPGAYDYIYAIFTVKPGAVIGDSLHAYSTISANGFQLTDTVSTAIRGSFDPNDKQATAQLSPAEVAAGKYIDYTIRFQNTGNDTAFRVLVSDILSNQLQANSLQITASSHNCKTTVKDNTVYFEFANILLPDKNSNEPRSHGFVSFRIKPQTNVAANTLIPNKGSIYFDYNAAVITNTATTLIKDYTVVPLTLISFYAVPQNDNSSFLYWTTANEINTRHFVIEQSTDGIKFNPLTIVNATGYANNQYSSSVLDGGQSIVYYRLKMIDNDGRYQYSPVIKIDRRKQSAGFTVINNPVKDFITININDPALRNSTCNIINSLGTVVKSFEGKQGIQQITVKELAAGIYYLKINNSSIKILIQ